ncbi:chloride transporter, ClC domain protein [Leptospira noguchii str. 1993005606]|uniref:Chloride transporter, ClC domain protein n=1 Tax=Leptospira noguchii str. 2007001578 TaxID=1049974 RepID=A0ABP2TCF1_9LEPT|nr:chloride transporter, ClC domain protein [Leptospira noguchii str. 2007001578]EMS88464.1 chloride transporter, ClC domain protein [Leptospira noguchii str. Hook]EPE83990.1 chloride transporter, ClC domain protein [Leptospira noguchii str. 1993005606]
MASGWRGGVIIPLFFLGACSGKLLFGFFSSENESFLMICLMAAVNSSVTKTPISTTILLSELYSFTPGADCESERIFFICKRTVYFYSRKRKLKPLKTRPFCKRRFVRKSGLL